MVVFFQENLQSHLADLHLLVRRDEVTSTDVFDGQGPAVFYSLVWISNYF